MATKTLNELFRDVIIKNELGGNLHAVLRFSDPDGVQSGKSGWSFGVCQFDTRNNPAALECLKACGFTPAEIAGIVNQTIDVKPLATKLQAAADTVARYDEAQLSDCLDRALSIATEHGVPLSDSAAILALADYDNQYYFSDIDKPGTLLAFIANLGRPVTADDVLDFKLTHTKYGETHPADCRRRYDNLMQVVRQEA
ncbi:MAG TPA: hypothetical protein VI298_08755 [Geobacteraceae bacterium]